MTEISIRTASLKISRDGIAQRLLSDLYCIFLMFFIIIPPTLNITFLGYKWPTVLWGLIIMFSAVIYLFGGMHIRWWKYTIIIVPGILLLTPLQFGGSSKIFALLPVICLIMLYLSSLKAHRKNTISEISRLIIIWSIPLSIYAITQYALRYWPILDEISVVDFRSDAYFGRAASTFGHPIMYGSFSGVAIIIVLFSNIRVGIKFMLIPINLIGMIISGSRSALIPLSIILTITILTYLVRLLRRPVLTRRIVIFVFSTLLPFLLVLIFAGNKLLSSADLSRYQNITESYSFVYRTSQWGAAYSRIMHNNQTVFFGYGPGAANELLKTQRLIPLFGPKTFDNSYITLAYDYGALGVFIIGITILYLLFSRSSLRGRLVVLFLSINAAFFDAFLWPAFLILIIISILLRSEGV
jgi:O-Antigen ligase